MTTPADLQWRTAKIKNGAVEHEIFPTDYSFSRDTNSRDEGSLTVPKYTLPNAEVKRHRQYIAKQKTIIFLDDTSKDWDDPAAIKFAGYLMSDGTDGRGETINYTLMSPVEYWKSVPVPHPSTNLTGTPTPIQFTGSTVGEAMKRVVTYALSNSGVTGQPYPTNFVIPSATGATVQYTHDGITPRSLLGILEEMRDSEDIDGPEFRLEPKFANSSRNQIVFEFVVGTQTNKQINSDKTFNYYISDGNTDNFFLIDYNTNEDSQEAYSAIAMKASTDDEDVNIVYAYNDNDDPDQVAWFTIFDSQRTLNNTQITEQLEARLSKSQIPSIDVQATFKRDYDFEMLDRVGSYGVFLGKNKTSGDSEVTRIISVSYSSKDFGQVEVETMRPQQKYPQLPEEKTKKTPNKSSFDKTPGPSVTTVDLNTGGGGGGDYEFDSDLGTIVGGGGYTTEPFQPPTETKIYDNPDGLVVTDFFVGANQVYSNINQKHGFMYSIAPGTSLPVNHPSYRLTIGGTKITENGDREFIPAMPAIYINTDISGFGETEKQIVFPSTSPIKSVNVGGSSPNFKETLGFLSLTNSYLEQIMIWTINSKVYVYMIVRNQYNSRAPSSTYKPMFFVMDMDVETGELSNPTYIDKLLGPEEYTNIYTILGKVNTYQAPIDLGNNKMLFPATKAYMNNITRLTTGFGDNSQNGREFYDIDQAILKSAHEDSWKGQIYSFEADFTIPLNPTFTPKDLKIDLPLIESEPDYENGFNTGVGGTSGNIVWFDDQVLTIKPEFKHLPRTPIYSPLPEHWGSGMSNIHFFMNPKSRLITYTPMVNYENMSILDNPEEFTEEYHNVVKYTLYTTNITNWSTLNIKDSLPEDSPYLTYNANFLLPAITTENQVKIFPHMSRDLYINDNLYGPGYFNMDGSFEILNDIRAFNLNLFYSAIDYGSEGGLIYHISDTIVKDYPSQYKIQSYDKISNEIVSSTGYLFARGNSVSFNIDENEPWTSTPTIGNHMAYIKPQSETIQGYTDITKHGSTLYVVKDGKVYFYGAAGHPTYIPIPGNYTTDWIELPNNSITNVEEFQTSGSIYWARKTDNTLHAFGLGSYGATGNGNNSANRNAEDNWQQVMSADGITPFKAIEMQHKGLTTGLKAEDGSLWYCGQGGNGFAHVGYPSQITTQQVDDFVIYNNPFFGAFITNGTKELKVFGSGDKNGIPGTSIITPTVPNELIGIEFISVTAIRDAMWAVDTNGDIWAVGVSGQNGTNTNSSVWGKITEGGSFKSVHALYETTNQRCMIAIDNNDVAWYSAFSNMAGFALNNQALAENDRIFRPLFGDYVPSEFAVTTEFTGFETSLGDWLDDNGIDIPFAGLLESFGIDVDGILDNLNINVSFLDNLLGKPDDTEEDPDFMESVNDAFLHLGLPPGVVDDEESP